MKITISKLATPIHDGDWHDPPFKWQVTGPGQEVSNFYTKAQATFYKRIRAKASSYAEASRLYIRT